MSKKKRLKKIYAEQLRQSHMLTQLMNRFVAPNPQHPALQEKLLRMGYGQWTPTPGVIDEDKEVYLSLDATTHLYVCSVEEALALGDDELDWKLAGLLKDDTLKAAAIAEYERRRVK